MFVFIIVLQVSAYGYHGEIRPTDPKYQSAYAREADCTAEAGILARSLVLPALASLDGVVCRKTAIRK